MYAYITPAGNIADIVVKPSPMRQLTPGERLLPYPVPKVDAEIYNVSAITPVPLDASSVSFLVTEKVGANEVIASRMLKQVDQEADAVYRSVLGDRGIEYMEAEIQALAFKRAGYSGEIPPFVKVWSDASGLSPEAAANNMLEQSSTWRQVCEDIRANRLLAKSKIRQHEFNAARAEWAKFLGALREKLKID